MNVTDDMVQTALEYLGCDPHPVAAARHAVTCAETNTKTIYARLLLSSKRPSVATKEAEAVQSEDYLQAKSEEATAVLDFENAKARVKWAEVVIELYRTEAANARAAERVR